MKTKQALGKSPKVICRKSYVESLATTSYKMKDRKMLLIQETVYFYYTIIPLDIKRQIEG